MVADWLGPSILVIAYEQARSRLATRPVPASEPGRVLPEIAGSDTCCSAVGELEYCCPPTARRRVKANRGFLQGLETDSPDASPLGRVENQTGLALARERKLPRQGDSSKLEFLAAF